MSLTLAEYAKAKGLPVAFLESLGVHEANGRGGVRLVPPYHNEDGTLFRNRLRLCLQPRDDKDKKFLWDKPLRPDDKQCLYGLDRLKAAREARYIVVVEGESDCHTLWHCDYPAVGVPGNKAWNDDRDAPHFDGILTVFVVIEPGKSGEGVLKWLGDSTIRKRARLVWFSEPKDPSDLFLSDPAAFRERFDEMLQNADQPQADPEEDRNVTVSMSETGLWLKDDKGELLRISQPFEVLGRCRSVRDAFGRAGDWGLLVRFQDWDGAVVEEIVSGERLHGDLGALCGSLHAAGFDVARDDRRRKLLASYLLGFETKDRVALVMRAGWRKIGGQSVFVLPHETIAAAPLPERVVLTAAAGNRRQGAYGASGTLVEWKSGVGRLASGHYLPMLAISTALAGPLLHLANFEGGGVHIFGPSSSGKTTVVKMAASVWRCGDTLPTWRATANGLEGELARASDSFMPLDELGQVDAREFAHMLYMQANSVGKLRMRRDTTQRDSLTWLTLVLSSGETPIEIKLQEERARPRAGHLVRLLDVRAARPNGAFDAMAEGVGLIAFVAECQRAATTHYGAAGPAFVRRLLVTGVTEEDVRSRVDAFVRAALSGAKSDAGQSARAAQRFGLIAAAGEMAVEFGIVPWPKEAPTEAAKWALNQWLATRGKASSYEERQAVAQVRGIIERFGDSRFDDITTYDPDRRPVADRLGFRKGDDEGRRWLVLPEAWRDEVCKSLDPNWSPRRWPSSACWSEATPSTSRSCEGEGQADAHLRAHTGHLGKRCMMPFAAGVSCWSKKVVTAGYRFDIIDLHGGYRGMFLTVW
jgi:uncharacterized protein (DUF927 family)